VWYSILPIAALMLLMPLVPPVRRPAVVAPLLGALILAGSLVHWPESAATRPVLRPTFDIAQAYSVTELKADNRGHYITQAEIEGTSVTVMIDTGATAVVMSYDDADNAGLKPFSLDFDVPVATANGLVKAARVNLRKVEVDNVMVRDVEGFVMPEGAMKGTLLGMSFLGRLSRFRVENGVLHLED
jgi:aspartyl protease family protein